MPACTYRYTSYAKGFTDAVAITWLHLIILLVHWPMKYEKKKKKKEEEEKKKANILLILLYRKLLFISACNIHFSLCLIPLIHISLATYANSVDPDPTPQNAASDQGLHCLLTGIYIRNRIKMKKCTRHP